MCRIFVNATVWKDTKSSVAGCQLYKRYRSSEPPNMTDAVFLAKDRDFGEQLKNVETIDLQGHGSNRMPR